MVISDLPFGTTDWAQVPATRHAGETGEAFWRTRQFGDVRLRLVDYSPGYKADHWCQKGHFILVLEGELVTELGDGRVVTTTTGISYQVADGAEPHRSSAPNGAKLFIVD